MNNEITDARIDSSPAQEQLRRKKTWVTPVVSESPVNELTSAAPAGSGVDLGIYS